MTLGGVGILYNCTKISAEFEVGDYTPGSEPPTPQMWRWATMLEKLTQAACPVHYTFYNVYAHKFTFFL